MLSSRLQAIYDLIKKNEKVADIGCDHGYLLIELYKNKKCDTLIGIENKVGPYNNFLYNLKINKLENKINTLLGDGLVDLPNNFNTVVLAGMGTKNILSIINKNKEKLNQINCFIVDSHTDTDSLRRYFTNIGYLIEKEKILEEDKIVYEIIRFIKAKKSYSDLEYQFGPYLLKNKDEEFKRIYLNKVSYLKEALQNASNQEYRDKLMKDIKKIEEIL